MKKLTVLIMILLIFSLVACSNENDNENTNKISIGSKSLTEGVLVAEMYAQALENEGFEVARNLSLGTPVILQEAMKKGDIDLYPEYTGTALTTILKQKPLTDDEEVYKIVKEAYKNKYNFIWLNQAPLNNTHAVVVKKETADRYNLKTLSDLSKVASEFVIGAKPEFKVREDGIEGLKRVYGGFDFKDIKSYDPGLRYIALENEEIDATVAFTTDGQIEVYDLVVLKDDKKLWPPYHIAPVIREDTLNKNPEIENILNKVSELLTDEVMQELNWKVDGEKKEYSEVATEFLIKSGIISE